MLNFRNRLLLLQFLTVLLTTILLGGGSHLLFISAVEKLQVRHLIHLSREGALAISSSLTRMTQQVEKLDIPGSRRLYGETQAQAYLTGRLRALPREFARVGWLDEQGAEVLKLIDTNLSSDHRNHKFDPLVQMSRLKPNQTLVKVKLHNSELGEPAVRLVHTYVARDEEEFLGTLVVSVPLKFFEHLLAELTQTEEASLAILSAKNELLTYHKSDLLFQQLPFEVEAQPAWHQLFGEDLMMVSNPVSTAGWKVVAHLPFDSFYAERTKLREISIVVGLMVMVFGALFSWQITSLLTRQIERLIDFAERVGRGDYSQQLPIDSSEEFNRLSNAFNQMVLELELHRHSRDSLRKIIETVIDPLIVTNRQGIIIQVNHAALELFSCDSAQILNRPLADIFADPPPLLRRASFDQGLLLASVNNLETRVCTHRGMEVSVLFSSAPCETDREDFGVVCILKDVTELVAARKSREKALLLAEDARRRIDVLLRSVPDGLVVTDPLGNVLMMNGPAERLLGQDAEKQVLAVAGQLLGDMETIGRATDIPLVNADTGAMVVIQAHASEVRDSQGKITGLVMLLRDVSRERSMEQMKTEFISTAAHELRTPLTSILGYSELMLDPENAQRFSSEETRSFLMEILGRAETLARIIDDLLSISRIESGQPLTLEIAPTDISDIVRRVVEQFRLTSETHSFELNLPADSVQAPIDAGRIQQVLENLLSNAVKYSPDNSLIGIRGELHPREYQILIEDRGLGMTPEQVELIFDKFYRADYSNTKTSGLGIGMSIVKQIIEGHAGEIRVNSELGVGTQVVVCLPLVE